MAVHDRIVARDTTLEEISNDIISYNRPIPWQAEEALKQGAENCLLKRDEGYCRLEDFQRSITRSHIVVVDDGVPESVSARVAAGAAAGEGP